MLQVSDLQPGDLAPVAADHSHPADRRARVAGWLLLRELLGRRLGCRPEEIGFGRDRCPACGGPDGRPVVVAPDPSVHFSISRSGGLVLVAVADVPVGVDVELIPPDDTAVQVSTLFHPAERREILAADPPQRSERFVRQWVRKEAYLKGVGTGVAHGLTHLNGQPSGSEGSGWTIQDVPVPAGAAAAVATGPGQTSA